MDAIEAIYKRKSIRALKREPIDEETIREVLEAAGRAPSWGSSQPWYVVVVSGEKLDKLRELWRVKDPGMGFADSDFPGPTNDDWAPAPECIENIIEWKENRARQMDVTVEEHDEVFDQLVLDFYDAPVCVFLCLKKGLSPYSWYDLGSFGENLMIAATDKGLGTMPAYSTVMYGDILHRELNIPEEYGVVLGIGIGKIDESNPMNKPDAIHVPIDRYTRFVVQ